MTPFALHLMRHGAPERPGLMLGRTDAPVSPAGHAACCARAAGLFVEAVVASDLVRAQVSAATVAEVRGLALTVDPRWRELDFGDWDGLPAEAIDGDALGRFWDDPDVHAPPGGERWSDLGARVAAALADLPERSTLVVAHGGAIRAALGLLCGFARKQLWAFELPYASLLSLRVWPGEPRTAQIIGLTP